MSKSRRRFLKTTALGVLGAAALRGSSQTASNLPPGEPPAFGTGPEVGPEVSATTFAEAEKLVQVQLTDGERSMAASSWRRTMTFGSSTLPRGTIPAAWCKANTR